MRPLVETDWLYENIKKVRIFDATWHLPNSNRNAKNEFLDSHIENSLFFDIDEHSDKQNPLPHMMPKIKQWQKIISNFGILKDDHIIVYDNSDLYSSCRLWFSFIYFGHDPNLVSVLNGGFKKWKKENKPTISIIKDFKQTHYIAEELQNLILHKHDIDKNLISRKYSLIDARNPERFKGEVKEPREGLKSGSIPGSKNLPFKKCLNPDNTFKSSDELKSIFRSLNLSENLAFTCGSGITASVLGLANSIINDTNPIIYDGSLSEYGLKKK